MKSKKILIAALSLGLIFAPTKPPVFAADAELISTDEDRFNEIKQSDMMHYQTMVNTYQNKKDGISEKQIANFSNVNKIYKQLDALRTEKQNYESELKKANQENASDAYKNDIITNIERVDKDIDQLKEEYAEVVRIREDLRINAEETDAYLVAYKNTLEAVRKSQNLFDLNKAKLTNKITIIRIEKAITYSEKKAYLGEVDKATTIEELDKIRQEVLKIKDEFNRSKQENEENPETEPDNQSPDQNETTAPNEEELKAAKESAIENLKSKTNLTEAQVKLFEEEISNAENLEELAEINKKVDESEQNAIEVKELSEAKDKAKQSLESSEHIDSEQKVIFENQIEEADTIDKILEIENNIKLADEKAKKEKIVQELANSKQILEEKLENTSLSPEQKDAFKDRILNAKNQADLEAIQIEIDQAYEKVKKEKELEANKKSLIEKLNSKENLRPDQKAEFEKQIVEATDKETLTKIEEEIILAVEVAKKEKEAQELENAKLTLEEKLENTSLSPEQKDAFKNRILNLENHADLEVIKKDIDQADEEAAKAKELAEAKEKAKQSLENAKNINLEQKTNFEKQIEDSNTIDQLLEIENNIKLADEKAQQEKIAQELASSKQILEEKLENTNLSSEQKDAFKDRILNAKNQADLEAIQIEIDQTDEIAKKEKVNQELEANKKSLIEYLNSKENLRPDQKEEFEKQIVEATDKETLANIEEEITLAVEVAKKEKIAQELAAAKESAIENLKAKINLTEAQVKLFEEAISNAENLEELAEINKKVNEADEKAKQEKVSQELENAKQLLEEKLENTGLSPEQKDTFKNRILKAERQAELETIESDINQADEKAIQEKVAQKLENAKSDLAEKLFSTSLNQDQKDSFLEKINKAADLEGLEAIDKEIEIASNQVDENIENETEKDPSNEETPSTPDPEEEKPKDEEKDPSEENPNEEEAGNLPENQDDNTTENPDPSNEDPVDDDNELENNPQNPDSDNGNNDSSDTSENVENTPTDDNTANGRENNTADGENPEKTSPEGQRPRNTKITRPIFGNTTPVSRPLENPSYLPSTITINETSTAKKDTIELKDDLKYLKKGTYKISDLEAKRDKIEAAIKKNKATVRAIGILEDLAPKTLAKNRAKINALLEQSQKLLAQANYALAEYNYLLSK